MISSATLTVLHLPLPQRCWEGDKHDTTTALGSAPAIAIPLMEREQRFFLRWNGRGQTRPPCDNLEIKIKSAYSPINMCVSSSYIYSNYKVANHAH